MKSISMTKLFHSNKYHSIPWDKFPELSKETITIINAFLRYKTTYCMERTIYDYFLFLPRALGQINVTSIEETTSDDIYEWINVFLKDKAQWTKRGYVKYLTVFYDYCLRHGFIAQSPVLRRAKVKNPLPKSKDLSTIEYAKIKRVAEILPLQERSVISLLDTSAARKGEILNIKVSDLDLVKCKVPIIGKGGIPGVLSFSKECSYLLKELIKERKSPDDYVFLTINGNKMVGKDIWKITSKLGKKCGVKGSLHPHRFRHQRVSFDVHKGGSLEDARVKLRHKSVQTTLIYVNLLPEDAQPHYERAMSQHAQARCIK